MDVSKLCRSCMKEALTWESDNFDDKLAAMFSFCTNIEITEDALPKQFCYDCIHKIKSCYTYITRAREVNNTLKNIASWTSVIVNTEINKTDVSESNNIITITKNPNNSTFNNVDSNSCDNFSYEYVVDKNTEEERKCTVPNEVDIEINDGQSKTIKPYDETYEFGQNDNDSNVTVNSENTVDKNNKVNMCPICKKVFVRVMSYKRHMKIKHRHKEKLDVKVGPTCDNKEVNDIQVGKKEEKTCMLCQRMFKSKLWFSRHMEREHSMSKVYTCAICSESFPTYSTLRYHKDRHSERDFPCGTCGKRFSLRKQLAAHALCHADTYPYACDQCHMRFKIKGILTGHMKIHSNEKPFLCYICGKNFTRREGLECHMRVHTGEKPFRCARCPFRARFASVLGRHERAHRGDRRHSCARCHKAFLEKACLERHMRVHTGERPYRCPRCARGFLDGWRRKQHMMRAHSLPLEDIPRMDRDGGPSNR